MHCLSARPFAAVGQVIHALLTSKLRLLGNDRPMRCLRKTRPTDISAGGLQQGIALPQLSADYAALVAGPGTLRSVSFLPDWLSPGGSSAGLVHLFDSCQIALPSCRSLRKTSACGLQSGIRLRGQQSCAARFACPRSIRPEAASYLGIVTPRERCATASGDTTFCRCCACSSCQAQMNLQNAFLHMVLPRNTRKASSMHHPGQSKYQLGQLQLCLILQLRHRPCMGIGIPALLSNKNLHCCLPH